jgi:sugar lactone lactonase YvrE
MTTQSNTGTLRRSALALAAILLIAPPTYAQEPVVVTGMATPESVVHDPEADVYLVSNINGGLGDADDNGFISRISPDGTITHLKWIDGEDPAVTLNAPKGIGLYGDRVYVADIDTVRAFDRATGAPLDAWVVPNAGFLNDLAVGADGTVYVTDTGISIGPEGFTPTGTAAVYRFDADGQPQAIAQGDALALPNGVVEAPQGLVLVSLGSNAVVIVGDDGSLTTLVELPQGQLDGVVVAADGSLLVSSIGANAVYRVDPAGAVSTVISDTPAADIGIDLGRSRVLIPQLNDHQLLIYPVSLD